MSGSKLLSSANTIEGTKKASRETGKKFLLPKAFRGCSVKSCLYFRNRKVPGPENHKSNGRILEKRFINTDNYDSSKNSKNSKL